MKETLRHHFNPLHLYCRLVDVGMGGPRARGLCRLYGKLYALFL